MKKLIIITILFCLAGCATHTDYIPVAAKCPAPVIPAKPDYPKLSKDTSAPEFAKWCIVSNQMCRSDNERLRAILKGYEHE